MNNSDYKEFQLGKLLFALMVPVQILVTYLFIRETGSNPESISAYIVFNSVLILIYLLFYGMTTLVSDDSITLWYGVGLIRKKIYIDKILSVRSVQNSWYNGLGIRIMANGILYSIDGNDAVELKFKDTKRVIRIGTKNSTQLKRKITKKMKAG